MLNLSSIISTYFNNFKDIIFHLINVHILFSIFLIILKIFFIITNNVATYNDILTFLSVSKNNIFFSFKIISIFTYFLINTDFLSLVFSMLVLYKFGNLLKSFLGEKKIFGIYFSSSILSGFFFYLLSYFNISSDYLTGALPGIYSIIFSCISFSADYPLNVLFLGPVKLKYFGIIIIVLILTKLSNGQLGIGTTEIFCSIWGYLNIKFLSKGIDITKPFSFTYVIFKKFINFLDKSSSSIKVIYRRKRN